MQATTSSPDLHTLTRQVQQNCHISDARHARDYSLCIYLLKMREYFRWEMGFGYGERLPEKQLGEWLVERERQWEQLEAADYRPLELAGIAHPPFEAAPINDHLLRHGLVYSGGYGGMAKPHFFLADLQRVEKRHGRRILVSGKEHARDLTAPPAMSQAGEVYIRRESLRRMLWEKLEEWRWHRQENAMAQAASFYAFDTDLEGALDQMADAETEAAILHELGEIEAGEILGDIWEGMLAAVWRTRVEYVARAVRDHLADTLVTLPALLREERIASIHFYFANFSGMRQALFPALQHAYREWREGTGPGKLEETIKRGQEHWQVVAQRLLVAYGDGDTGAMRRLEQIAAGIEQEPV